MNTSWNAAALYTAHAVERATKPPHQFANLDRSHLASRISLPAFDSGFVSTLFGLGRITTADNIEVHEGYRPMLLKGVRALGTQAAHRGSGCTWVHVSKECDEKRFNAVAGRIPTRFIQSRTDIRAPLHLFAGSRSGAAMLLGSERATTVLPAWENRLNSYMEGHCERQARNELLRSAMRFKSIDPAVIAAYTLDRLYTQFIPDLLKGATEMAAYYDARAKETHQSADKFLAERAEDSRDFIKTVARNHDVPPTDPTQASIPAASFGSLVQSISTLFNTEQAPGRTDIVEGWSERRVGSVDLIVPRSSVDQGGTHANPSSDAASDSEASSS